MRVRSHWFRAGAPRSAAEVAGAAAFTAFRLAQNALKNVRKADYELPAGEAYFAFLAEWLAFLVHCADRIAHARGDEAWRIEFTTALANKAGEFLAGNEADLLGADAAQAKRRFVALVNQAGEDYAACDWTEGPGYGLLRCFGHRVAATMHERERTWAVSQVMECEAPEAVTTLERVIAGLLDPLPRRRERGTGVSGE
jgi:hypothetical protein